MFFKLGGLLTNLNFNKTFLHWNEYLQNAPLWIGGETITLSEIVGISCPAEVIIRTIAGRNTIMNMPVIIEIWIKDEQLIQQHNESPGWELSLYFVFLCVIIFDRKPLAVLYLSSVSISLLFSCFCTVYLLRCSCGQLSGSPQVSF